MYTALDENATGIDTQVKRYTWEMKVNRTVSRNRFDALPCPIIVPILPFSVFLIPRFPLSRIFDSPRHRSFACLYAGFFPTITSPRCRTENGRPDAASNAYFLLPRVREVEVNCSVVGRIVCALSFLCSSSDDPKYA